MDKEKDFKKENVEEKEGSQVPQIDTDSIKKNEKDSKKSKSAVEKVSEKKDKKVEDKVELEREYVVPLRRGFLKVPQYRRAKKAVRVLKEFLVRHMQVRDRDLNKIKIDINLNNEIWFRGIKKPLAKIKVHAKKVGEIVYVTLADPSDFVKFRMARDEKKKAVAEESKKKAKKVGKSEKSVDENYDGVEDKVEVKEDMKSEAEMDQKVAKARAKEEKHLVKEKGGRSDMMPEISKRKSLKK